jgi:hypothetical protein
MRSTEFVFAQKKTWDGPQLRHWQTVSFLPGPAPRGRRSDDSPRIGVTVTRTASRRHTAQACESGGQIDSTHVFPQLFTMSIMIFRVTRASALPAEMVSASAAGLAVTCRCTAWASAISRAADS